MMREIDARIKFATHFLVATILVIGGGAQITSLGNILGFWPDGVRLDVDSIFDRLRCLYYQCCQYDGWTGWTGRRKCLDCFLMVWPVGVLAWRNGNGF